MSSTSNIQNLLVNVFRPSVVYDPSTGYVPKLNICNVDTISAKSLAVTTFGLGDSNGNIFIGSNAGLGAVNVTDNTALGVSAGSGLSNTSGCIYIGNLAGFGATTASNVISIGKSASGFGTSNIYIGSNTGGGISGINNILIGHGLSNSNISNSLQIGRPGSIIISGDLANKRVGINTTTPAYTLDVCGTFALGPPSGRMTYETDACSNSIVNFRSSNARAILNVYGDVSAEFYYGTLLGPIGGSNIRIGNGTSNAPSYSFSNATGAGMYYGATPPTLGFALGGNSVMEMTTSTATISNTTIAAGVTMSNGLVSASNSGTAAIPTYSFSNSPNTGMFLQGVNQLAFSTGSAQQMVISNSNVGIGLSAPTYTLDVSGSFRATGSNVVGGVTLSNNNISNTGTLTTGNSTVVISNGSIVDTSTNPIFRLATGVSTFQVDMSGGNISNSGTTTSSNFITLTASSNSIGGVILSNSNARVGAGIVNIPSLTFGSDASLGLYSSGTNQIGFASAGIQRMVISNSNVGINTPTPAYILDVSGTIRGTSNLLFSTNGSAGNPLLATTGFSNTGFYFASDAQPAVCQGSQEITRWSGAGMFTSISGTTTAPSIGWLQDAAGTGFSRPAVGKLSFITSGTEKMTISGGNVGIGLTAPSNSLDVTTGTRTGTHSSNLALYATRAAASNSDPIVSFSHTNGAAGVGIGWNSVVSIGTNTTNDLFLYSKGAGNIVFSDLSGFVERGRFSSNGNMGIGCNAPAYKLDVNNALTAPAINMSSYPRFGFSNVTIVNGLTSATLVGQTVNFNAATITMDSNLSSWISSNATVGCSFQPLVSGIWSINVYGNISTVTNSYIWIDGSSNNTAAAASNGINVIGNQYLTACQPFGTFGSMNYTGYLSASNFYKIKSSASVNLTPGTWNAVFTFLGATSTTTAYPFKLT